MQFSRTKVFFWQIPSYIIRETSRTWRSPFIREFAAVQLRFAVSTKFPCIFQVRSVTMDKWKDLELQKMKVGGNRRAREFFEEEEESEFCCVWNNMFSNVWQFIDSLADWDTMSIYHRYNSKSATLYRDKILTLAEGKQWSIEEARARLKKSSSSSGGGMSQSKSYTAMSSYQDETSSYQQQDLQSQMNTREFKDKRDTYFNSLQATNASRPENLKPSEGGRYAGFGNTPMNPPTRSQSEVFDTTLSSLTSGWSMLSFGANKVKENALKYGSYASQKVRLDAISSVFRFCYFIFIYDFLIVWRCLKFPRMLLKRFEIMSFCFKYLNLCFWSFDYVIIPILKVKEGGILDVAQKEVTSLASKVCSFHFL